MKKSFLYILMWVVIASCGTKKDADKQSQLDALKKQRTELDDKIKNLETEIAKEKGDTAQVKAQLVTVADITKTSFASYIDLQAKVDAEENVTVTPQMPGAIKNIYVTEGQQVRKGQVLAELDNETSKKQLQTLQTQLNFAQDMYAKQKALWDQKIGTEVQYLSAKNNVETMQKQMDAANQQLEMTKLISPINGVVDEVDIKAGQIASPGYNGIRVVNTSRLKVKGEVSESYASFVKTGNAVKLYFPDMNKEMDSKISFVSKVIDPSSRSFTAEAKIPGEGTFKPNMIVVMKIADYENKNAVVVDINLIQKSSDADYIYVVGDENGNKIAQRRTVTIGKIYNGKAEITSGLNAGDKIIVAGYQNVVNGQVITYN